MHRRCIRVQETIRNQEHGRYERSDRTLRTGLLVLLLGTWTLLRGIRDPKWIIMDNSLRRARLNGPRITAGEASNWRHVHDTLADATKVKWQRAGGAAPLNM